MPHSQKVKAAMSTAATPLLGFVLISSHACRRTRLMNAKNFLTSGTFILNEISLAMLLFCSDLFEAFVSQISLASEKRRARDKQAEVVPALWGKFYFHFNIVATIRILHT